MFLSIAFSNVHYKWIAHSTATIMGVQNRIHISYLNDIYHNTCTIIYIQYKLCCHSHSQLQNKANP